MKKLLFWGIVLLLLATVVAASPPAFNQYPLSNPLEADSYWRFTNNGSDMIGEDDLTVSSDYVAYTPMADGVNAWCDGGDTDHMTWMNSPTLDGNHTIALWVNLTEDSYSGTDAIFGGHNGAGDNSYGYRTYFENSSRIKIALGGVAPATTVFYFDLPQQINDSQWHHLVFVHEAGTRVANFSLYLNGVNVTDRTIDTDAATSYNSQDISVFSDYSHNSASHSDGYEGSMDDFIVWRTHPLTQSEIYTVYAGNYTGDIGGDELNISSVNPADGDEFNTQLLNFNFTVNSSTNFDCSLVINGTLNQTNESITAGNEVYVEFEVAFDATTEDIYYHYISCNNSETTKNTSNKVFLVDGIFPNIDVTGEITTNDVVSFGLRNITSTINITDTNLWGINVSIDGAQDLFYTTGIAGGNYTYNLNFNPATEGLSGGTHTIQIYASDSHTATEIPEYKYRKGIIENSITYDFDSGWIKVKPKKNKLFTSFETKKHKDRYSFEIERNPFEKFVLGTDLEFEVTSSSPLVVVESEYRGHIVSPSLFKWLDFESDYPDAVVTTEQINDKKIRVLVEGIEDDVITFNSIGGLNVLNENYTFYYGSSTETWSNQTLETGINAFTLNFTVNDSFVDDVNAVLFYNDTSYTPTKTSADDYIYFTHSLAPQLLGDDNFTNKTFYWNYTITNAGDGSNITNETTHKNQSVYKMIVSNCSWTPSTYKIYNFTTINQSNSAEVNTTVSALVEVWNQSSAQSRTYTFIYGDSYYHHLCMYPDWASFNTNYEFQFDATDYDQREYTANNDEFNNSLTTQVIYMSYSGDTTAITITLLDENDDELIGYTIEAHRYDLGTDSYILIDSEESNNQGKAVFNLDVSSDEYQFIVKDATGVIVHTEPKQQLIETSYTFRIVIGTSPESIQLKLQNLDYSLMADKATESFSLTWDDSLTNYITLMNFTVTLSNTSNNVQVYGNTSTESSGTDYYNVTENGVYIAYAFVTSADDGNVYLLSSVSLDIREEYDVFGVEALIMAFLFIGTMAFLGFAYSAEAGLILTIIGMITFYALGFVEVAASGVVSLIITFVIVLVRLDRR